ncbi:hypothetical protein [Dolichospermum compactum]|uniref:hypothetical protein n=1 Tax=Dolichospermum compactum TaxID=136073 RepID=UPI000BBC4539|nr:hypothetical protein [Dolichospermum compactum]
MQQRFAIAYQYFLVLVQNTTLNGDKNQKKPIVTPGGAECGIKAILNKEKALTLNQIQQLAERFHVNIKVFLN